MTSLKWNIAQKLEIRWWKNYLRKKDPQEYLEWKKNYWNNFLQKTETFFNLSLLQSSLDAGCGPSGINMVLTQDRIVAIDPLLDSYEKLEHFQYAKQEGVEYEQSSIEDYVPEKPFDLVCCLNVINHVNNIEQSMVNLHQCTAPNGWLLLSIDAHNYTFLKHLFRAIPGDALHPHQLSLNEYKEMCTRVGFEVKAVELIKRELIFNYYLIIAQRISE
jgi:2-polyprenyl-6-hydroxyphenyl methylase/3-demethylubiquinone-9 3-methyltransferase